MLYRERGSAASISQTLPPDVSKASCRICLSLLACVSQFHTRSEVLISKRGKFFGSYRPSPRTHKVIGVLAPVPAATMRRGRESDAPGPVTRTGRIALMPWPGTSLSARKSNPSCTYVLMTGAMSGGMLYPFIVSQSVSAFGSDDLSCTVA